MKHIFLTLGSLFDGIGGFCLAALMAGITPVWASEIDPFPIRVTEKRFPNVLQLGDVHAIDGGKIPPVDIITFGSPCQNLSVAGKRTGLSGEQSSLFFEAIRVIREMRRGSHGQYPKWAVWENVPGALSTHNGQDFRQVLESLIQIPDPTADVPMPAEGKWLGAGEIVGDHCSLAWRILDASKGWGVPQRRRRIFAVLDLDGTRAGQVLFESEGLSGYTPPGREAQEGAATGAEARTRTAGSTGIAGHTEYNGDLTGRVASTVGVNDAMCTGQNGVVVLNDQGGNRMDISHEETCTLRAHANHPPCVLSAKTDPQENGRLEKVPSALDDNDQHAVCAMDVGFFTTAQDQAPSLMARAWKDPPIVSATQEYLVRRLTPDECCRLQGYPDGWCHHLESDSPDAEEIDRWRKIFAVWDSIQGKNQVRTKNQIIKWLKQPYSDAAAYKAYGNSVAVPCVFFVLAGIAWAVEQSKAQDAF